VFVDPAKAIVGIKSFGNASLVGDNDEFKALILPVPKGFGYPGVQLEFFQAGDISADLFIQNSVPIDKNSTLHGRKRIGKFIPNY
jgi:hypothetical protein